MRQGVVFSIDILIGITIAMVLIAGIFFNLSKSQKEVFSNLYLSKLSNDALITLGKNRTLEILDSTIINNTLTNILPANLAFKFNTTVYQCNNPSCDSFDTVDAKNIIINSNIQERDSVIVKRGFLTFENNRIKYFSIAYLWVWLK